MADPIDLDTMRLGTQDPWVHDLCDEVDRLRTTVNDLIVDDLVLHARWVNTTGSHLCTMCLRQWPCPVERARVLIGAEPQ